ncbi:MAG TPA: hypothetical protein VGI28_15405 [Stellaceae bacterium]
MAAVVAIATAAISGGAEADPLIDLGGYTGPIQIKFQNYESFTSLPIAPGSMNFGVIEVTSIENSNTGANIWVQGQSGQFLSGVFNDITVTSVTPTGTGFITTNSGGVFDFFLNSSNFDPAQGTSGYTAGGCAVGELCYNGITNIGGVDALNLELVPGATTDPTNTLSANTSSVTTPLTGSALGYADITGGADDSQFGRSGEGPTALGTFADFNIVNDFCSNGQPTCAGPTSSDWQLFSHDPVSAIVISEPASLGLLATALLGLGFVPRLRRRR